MNDVIAITGASGFVGRHFLTECLRRKTHRVRVLTRSTDAFREIRDADIEVFQGDLLRYDCLAGFLSPGVTLVHLAYLHDTVQANITATQNLIRAAKERNVKRVVHCSTAIVVGFRDKGIITEAAHAQPDGPYQQVKYQIEELLRAELPPTVELAILRPTEVIGRGGKGLQPMIRRLDQGRPLANLMRYLVLKSRRFNYVSVSNVVAALLLLATTSTRQMDEVYNLSDDDDVDNNYAAVEMIIDASLGKRQRSPSIGIPRWCLSVLFRLLPHHSPPDRVYSYAKLSALGYRKVTRLRETISELALSQKRKTSS